MADKQAAFQIRTSLDLKGIEDGLKKLREKLESFTVVADTRQAQSNIKSLDQVVKSLNGQFTALNQRLTATSKGVAKVTDKVGPLNKGLKQTKNAILDVSRRVFVWGSMSAAIFGTIIAIKELYDMTLKVNTALGELKKVIPASEDFGRLKGVAFDVSIEFGQDPLAALQIMKRFAQSGLDTEETLKATRTAMLGINVTGAETEKMFNALIGANRIFGIAFEDSARVIDKVQRVQARYAVDTKDLIDAITAIGPAITVLKGDINDLFGIIGSMVEAARITGREASNSLKRVLARIVAPDGIRALERVNVKVLETADSFRPLRAIVADLAKVWPKLTQAEKQSLSVTLAQVRQYPKFFAWIENVQRGMEASTESQNAFGEALVANRSIMNTYQKEMDVASAQIAKFAEGFYTAGEGGSSLVGVITDLKARFGEITQTAGAGLKTFIDIATVLGSLTLVGGLLASSILKAGAAWGDHKKAVEASGRAALFASGGFRALGASALAALPAIGLITAIIGTALVYWNSSSRAQRKYNRVIKDSVGVITEYKRSLEGVNFSGIINSAVEEKFQAISKILDDFRGKSTGVIKDAKDIQQAFAQLLHGKDLGQLDAAELTTIQKVLQRFAEVIRTSILAPVQEATNELFSDINASANKLGADLSTKQVMNLGVVLGIEGADWTRLSDQQIKRLKELDRLASSGRFGVDRRTEAEKAETKALRERISLIHQWVEEYTRGVDVIVEALKKRETALEKVRDLEKDDPKRMGIEELYSASVDIQADRLLHLVDVDKRIAEALVASGKIENQSVISLGETFKAKAQEDILAALKTLIQKRIEQLVGVEIALADEGKLAGELAEMIFKSGKDGGIKSVSFDMTGFLSNLKKSTAFMATQIGTALDSAQVAESIVGDKEIYDGVAERIAIIDDGIKNVITHMGNNAQQIQEYATQLKGLKLIQDMMAADPDLAYTDDAKYKEVEERIEKLTQDLAVLNTVQKNSASLYEPLISYLTQYKKAMNGLKEEEKLRITNIKSWAKQLEQASKLAGKIADVQITDPTRIVNNQLERNRELFKLQMENLEILKEAGKLTGVELTKLQQKVHAQAELNDQSIFYNGILTEANNIQSKITDKTDAVAEAMTGVFISTQEWLDLLNAEGGFGDLMVRQIHAIGDAIAELETADIAKALSQKLQSTDLVGDLQSDMEALQKQAADEFTKALQSQAYIGSVQKPLIDAGNEVAVIIKTAMIQAAAVWQDMLAVETAKTEIQGARRQAGLTDPAKQDIIDFMDAALPSPADKAPAIYPATPVDTEPWQRMTADFGGQVEAVEAALAVDQQLFEKTKEQLATAILSASTEEQMLAILKEMYATMQTTPNVKEMSDLQKKASSALAQRLGSIVSLAVGSLVAKNMGKSNEYVGVGSTLGGMVGTLGGPIGTIGGKFIGGIVGGLFGKKEEPADVEEVKATLKNIESNTAKLVDRLSPELINAPSGFSLPNSSGYGTNVSMTNTFIVQGGNTREVVNEIESQLNDLMNRSTSYAEVR